MWTPANSFHVNMEIAGIPLLLCLLVLHQLAAPVHLQSIQGRHYRPYPDKCDRYGRCSPKEGYIEEVDHDDDYKANKDRPPELSRDDWPTRPLAHDSDVDKDKGGRGGQFSDDEYAGDYNPKPAIYRDEVKPANDRPGSGYNPKPPEKREDNLKPEVRPSGYGYNSKPPLDRDDDLKISRPSRGGGYGGGYNPKPPDREELKPTRNRPSGGGGYGGGYNSKPPLDRDGDIKPGGSRPSGGGYNPNGDGYNPSGGGYNPKPVIDRDDDLKAGREEGGYNTKPGGNRGGYNNKPDQDDYEIKPARRVEGGYPDRNRRPRPNEEDIGGYEKPKDDDYNDDYKYEDRYDDDGGRPRPVIGDNCICVPYYQCKEGHIVTDGSGIIDARKKPDPNEELPLDGKFKPPSCGPYHVCCNTPETSTVMPYEHRCGVRNPSGINSRILSPSNKGEADFGEWPWQAAVLKSEGKVNIFMCGGVLIDKYHVLTVAHCVFHLYEFNEYPLKVRLGEWDTQRTTEFLAHEDYQVSKIIVHPEFRNTSLWNDVAVLRLQDPVLFAPHIDTVCLPQYDEIFAGHNCVVTGWGKDAYKGGTFSNVMKEVALQVIDNYKCEEMLRKTRLGRFFQLNEGFLCAGGEYGLDSCKGDGGGPLVCYRKDKSYALAGIVSWGIDCGQTGVPGVYVKIQKYLDWISKMTGVTLQDYWPKH